MRALGTLTKWDADRGFGFVRLRDSGVDIFVHITAFPRSGRQPQVGDALSFEIVTATDGRKQAKAVTYDIPQGRADFTLAPIERKPNQQRPNEQASRPMPVRTSAPHPERRRQRESHRRSTGGLGTLIFAVLLIGGLAFGYRKFLEYRAVAVDTLHGRSAETSLAPTNPSHSAPGAAASPGYRCDGRTHCSQMRSCADATQVLQHCPGTQMDGDGDGIPCEQQWCN
ncbi:MAG: cold shock domain-containing protein [Lysobacter sp.]|nr:cold shock domain-containing protein [Lysobacter sp.]